MLQCYETGCISQVFVQNKMIIFIKLQITIHEKLNQPNNPCEPSLDYDFGRCVEEYVAKRAGCQPPWRRFNFTGIPECNTWDKMWKYSNNSAGLSETEGGMVIEKTKCLLPCTFMEYKVIV